MGDWRIVLLLGLVCALGCRAAQPRLLQASIPSRPPPLSNESLQRDIHRLCGTDFAGRGSYQAGGAKAAQFLVDEFTALGYEVIRQKVRGAHAENIIAVKRGDAKAIIVSAHHDHLGLRGGKIYRGADDNASGVAALLALARARAERSYRHTVLFVSFGAEEDGLVGSGVYIHDPYWPLDQTKAVINFDMVGRRFFEAGANQDATVAVVGLEDSSFARRLALRAAERLSLNLLPVPARLLELFGLHDRTDDWWFRRQGILSIHFSTGLHRDYHKVTDTEEKIIVSQVLAIAKVAGALLDGLASPPIEGGANLGVVASDSPSSVDCRK